MNRRRSPNRPGRGTGLNRSLRFSRTISRAGGHPKTPWGPPCPQKRTFWLLITGNLKVKVQARESISSSPALRCSRRKRRLQYNLKVKGAKQSWNTIEPGCDTTTHKTIPNPEGLIWQYSSQERHDTNSRYNDAVLKYILKGLTWTLSIRKSQYVAAVIIQYRDMLLYHKRDHHLAIQNI